MFDLRVFNLVLLLASLRCVVTLNDVDRECVNNYSDAASNDELLGTWYQVYKFGLFLNLMPSPSCPTILLTKANHTEVQRYSQAYRRDNPYSFNDNPLLVNEDNYFFGMLMGNNEAKFYVFDPKTTFYKEDRYQARVYKRVNREFIVYHRCAFRGHEKWLLSRRRNLTNAELDDVIKSIQSEVRNMETQKYCH